MKHKPQISHAVADDGMADYGDEGQHKIWTDPRICGPSS